MRLTLYTDYSLRVLLYLGAKNIEDLSTIKEISDAYGISKNHLMKVTHELGKLGYIETVRGRGGGIRLALKPKDIVIGKLVRQTEEDFYLVDCFNPESVGCIISPVCSLKGALNKALHAYIAVLDTYTLDDFLHSKEELAALLFPNQK
ncbi:Rrf2 family transcriptional regulator [Viridibacillus sp. FSL R5-0477]|uniref:HTH-type transcriptional regulator NsrR n=1 Tax=Viridibacillus arenosi FSL R5-213 TaxID=1227360 RepID=W4ERE9_9BACL|nr:MULTISPECIES: Rrf2 family transcriptional regulator [Viridibacillus]ETT82577.1 HTH-type transcriptional regulator [Viridibacillus arenosi FSL R5-213]OMC85543.1 Rrf2 family transcriptional regulator [Viridibacillus sp. FSL H8-0123]OMC87183.1 Rrf2 family transcriptional regulator [Viridibacillus sp. FSL H7-0596]OMC92342.1 Rrf2 family transcriptional regulator [Viridibacillus arenosi]